MTLHQRPHTQLRQDGKAAVHAPRHHPLRTITEEKQLSNEHKLTWDEYHLQEAVIFHGRAAIVADVMPQYIEEKEVDYLGYSMESMLTLIAHLKTWPVIANT